MDRPLINEERPLPPRTWFKATLIILFVMYAMTMLGIGVWGLDKCPTQSSSIPILLIITGAYGVLLTTVQLMMDSYLSLFWTRIVFGIFIVNGSILVFKIYKPSFDPTAGPVYCNKIVYFFALVSLEVAYIVVGLFTILASCIGACLWWHWSDLEAEAEERDEIENA